MSILRVPLYLSKQSSAVLSSEYSWQLALVPRESMRVPSARFVRADMIESTSVVFGLLPTTVFPLLRVSWYRALVVCLYHEGI